jgi:hypothetical protein
MRESGLRVIKTQTFIDSQLENYAYLPVDHQDCKSVYINVLATWIEPKCPTLIYIQIIWNSQDIFQPQNEEVAYNLRQSTHENLLD